MYMCLIGCTFNSVHFNLCFFFPQKELNILSWDSAFYGCSIVLLGVYSVVLQCCSGMNMCHIYCLTVLLLVCPVFLFLHQIQFFAFRFCISHLYCFLLVWVHVVLVLYVVCSLNLSLPVCKVLQVHYILSYIVHLVWPI